MLKKGDDVPAVTLSGDDGKEVSLNKLKKAIIYFYPKDNTPGCTTEACTFRDFNEDIMKSGWRIYGISADSIKSHAGFKQKHELNFSLLSDENKEAINGFGAIGEKSMYGKIFKGTLRVTFAVDNGKVIHVWENVKPKEHPKEVFDWIRDNN